MPNTDILQQTEDFVYNLFKDRLPGKFLYHNFRHSSDVAGFARKIGKKSGLNDTELEIVTLAGWFHDTGFVDTYIGHEEKSMEIASAFLKQHNYHEDRINRVTACIAATKMPQKPQNLLEQVLCDADLSHLGTEEYAAYSDLLRSEWESLNIKKIDDIEWYKNGVDFLASHRYFTTYARKKFEDTKAENLIKAQKAYRKMLAAADDEAAKKVKMKFEQEKLALEQEKLALKKNDDKAGIEREKIAFKKEQAKTAERGIETMFRNTIRTHVEFSAMADSKANIMISINTLILGIIVTGLIRKLGESPFLIVPTFILLSVCLICIIFAVMVTRPKITSGTFTKDDIYHKRTNLLFFGNFFNMALPDFEWGMHELMNDKEYLYGSMIKDFYFLGQVLGKKYKYLRLCYTIFMYGMIIAVLAYVIAFVLNPGSASIDILG